MWTCRIQLTLTGTIPMELTRWTRPVDDPPNRMRTCLIRLTQTETSLIEMILMIRPVNGHPARMTRRWTQTLRAESKSMARQDFVRSNPLNCLPVH